MSGVPLRMVDAFRRVRCRMSGTTSVDVLPPDAPQRVYDQRRCTGCDHRTSCRGSRGSASLPSQRHRLVNGQQLDASYNCLAISK